MGMRCIGIDVGGTSVKMGLFEVTGSLLEKWEIATHKEDGGSRILPDVAASIKEKMKEHGIDLKTELAGVGLGVPGPVLPDGYVEVCVNLGWRDMNPQEELRRLLDGIPVKSGNDANVAALGEMWQGGAKGCKDLVMITLGTGVGGGVIIDERIVAGRHGLGGEMGHIHVRDEEKEPCNCGGVGCVEQICSATGIAREARRKMSATGEPSALREFGESVTAKNVLDAAKTGDKLALEVMDVFGYYLGLTLSMAVMTVDPEIFVIGGGVSKAGQFLIDAVQKHYDHFTPISERKGKLALATLGNDAGIYGAARLIL